MHLFCYGLSVPSTVFIVPVCTGTGVIVFFYRMFGLHSVCCAVCIMVLLHIFSLIHKIQLKNRDILLLFILLLLNRSFSRLIRPVQSIPFRSVRSSVHTKYVLLFFILSHSTFSLLLLFSFHLYLLYSTHISSFTIETWFSSFRQVFRRWYSTEDEDEDVRANDCFLLPLHMIFWFDSLARWYTQSVPFADGWRFFFTVYIT